MPDLFSSWGETHRTQYWTWQFQCKEVSDQLSIRILRKFAYNFNKLRSFGPMNSRRSRIGRFTVYSFTGYSLYSWPLGYIPVLICLMNWLSPCRWRHKQGLWLFRQTDFLAGPISVVHYLRSQGAVSYQFTLIPCTLIPWTMGRVWPLYIPISL